jgi:hypothetical protein
VDEALGVNDLRVQRDRGKAQDEVLDRLDDGARYGSAAVLVATTTVATYPVTAGAFYAANVLEIDGAETEGTAASYTAQAGTVYILNVGTQIPAPGTKVVAHGVGGRWVFRYDG